MKSIEEDKQFVEEIGVIAEGVGATRLQGRIAALLLLHSKDGLTLEEIADFLGASRSSVSLILNASLQHKQLYYYTKSGDRKKYFKLPSNTLWLNDIEEKIHGMDGIAQMIQKTIDYKNGEDKSFDDYGCVMVKFMKRIQNLVLEEIKKFREENCNLIPK